MKKNLIILFIGLGQILVATAVLVHVDNNRELGEPGLIMIDEKVFDEEGQVVNTNTVAFPDRILNYSSTPRPITRVELDWLPSDTTYARRVYQAPDGFAVQNNVVMMGLDRSSIHKPQICLTGQGWRIATEEHVTIQIGGDNPVDLPVCKITAERQVEQMDGSSRLVKAVYIYWFVADNYVTSRHGERMWWMARELMQSGTLQRWAYVSLLGYCYPGQEEETYDRMKEFISASVPHYHQLTDTTIFSALN